MRVLVVSALVRHVGECLSSISNEAACVWLGELEQFEERRLDYSSVARGRVSTVQFTHRNEKKNLHCTSSTGRRNVAFVVKRGKLQKRWWKHE